VPSDTTFDCRNNKLVPTRSGNLLHRSEPEVAILIEGSKNVLIKNCRIERFDFGVFAINSKQGKGFQSAQPRIQLLENSISARFSAISLIQVDKAEIKNNQIRILARLGRGIYVGRDSDNNQILNNTITTKPDTDAVRTFRAPGPELPSNPVLGEGGVAAVVIGSGEPPLLTAVTSGRVYQFTSKNYANNNLVQRNTIIIPGEPVDGIAVLAARATQISFNTITGAKSAIRVGFQRRIDQVPGRCKPNGFRRCLGQNDCRIPEIDDPTKGICTLPPEQLVSWLASGNIINDNLIDGSFGSGIGVAGQHTTIRGNCIKGTLRKGLPDPPFPLGGICLNGKYGLETTTITQNTLIVEQPLRFVKMFQALTPSFFGAKVWSNDFTGYSTAAVRTDNSYMLPSELSFSGKGNYWGTPQGLNKSMVLELSGMRNGAVTDHHHRIVSVAEPCP
jgi:hypothetical protein